MEHLSSTVLPAMQLHSVILEVLKASTDYQHSPCSLNMSPAHDSAHIYEEPTDKQVK